MQAPLFEKGLQEVACKRSVIIQKQPFTVVLQNRCSEKFPEEAVRRCSSK